MSKSNDNYSLSEKDYENLADACDEILHINLSLESVIAVNFLHTPRYSPANSNFYKDIFKNKKITLFYYFKNFFISIIFMFKKIFLSLNSFEYGKEEFGENLDFLFVSHYIGSKDDGEYYDSYFGEVIKQINSEKFRVAVLYINHTKENPQNLYISKNVKTFIIANNINFKSLIKIYLKSLLAFFKFKGLTTNYLLRNLSTKVRLELFSPGAIQAQIIAHHISSFVTSFSPKCVITTYEGHAWERLSYRYIRKNSADVKCMAYQHAPIFKHQHAIKRGIGSGYDPDIIFASGVESENFLSSCNKLSKSRILLLGSGRCLNNLIGCERKVLQNKTCLVVPEGTFAECLILFEFSLECARKMKDVKFIWRLPPQIDITALQNRSIIFNNLEKNISLKKSSLEDDIYQSEYVLYRGSSVVIHAVLQGLMPIYLMKDGELSMDPLFRCGDSERVVKNVDDFNEKILSNKMVSRELRLHCSMIYTNMNVNSLEKSI